MPKKTKKTKVVIPGPPPKKKKAKKKPYFGLDVQDAIVRYNTSDNDTERNKIYQEEIHYAFDKLCENIINTFKFTYFDSLFQDVKQEVTSFLVMNIHKYDHTRGSKAFSYFSIVAKNYLILHNNNNYKKLKLHTDASEAKIVFDDHKSNDKLKEMIEEMIYFFEKNISSMFKKKIDIDIAYSIVELLKRIDEIENFNKKSLYLLIREMTGVNTNRITKVVNEMKKKYYILQKEFNSKGHIKSIDNFFGK